MDPSFLRGMRPYNETSDIFSAGCVLFQLLSGKHLIGGQTHSEILLKNYNLSAVEVAE